MGSQVRFAPPTWTERATARLTWRARSVHTPWAGF
jgi:hypothetical protein